MSSATALAMRNRRINRNLCATCGLRRPANERLSCDQCLIEKRKCANARYLVKSTEIKERQRQYRINNKLLIKNRKASYASRCRVEVLSHYGPNGKLKCCLCQEARLGTLTIDHIDGGGKKHRNQIGRCGLQFYAWLKMNDFPLGFRTLCSNCNIREYNRKRRPLLIQTADAIKYRKHIISTKAKYMAMLGGKCVECGEDDIDVLTTHHIDNNGAAHRELIGGHGVKFHRAILKSGDFAGLECRCFSCNDCAAWERNADSPSEAKL